MLLSLRQLTKARQDRSITWTAPRSFLKVERVVRMSRASRPTRIDKRVLEVLLNVVDALAQWIHNVESSHLPGETPYDGDVLFAQCCAHVIRQQPDGVVQRGISSTTEVFPGLSVD